MVVKLKSYRAFVTLNKEEIKTPNKIITTGDISTSNEQKNQTIILNDIINLYSTNPQTVDENGTLPYIQLNPV